MAASADAAGAAGADDRPSSGLAVYHCDIFGSNELQQGTAENHYQCALLQADGSYLLNAAKGNITLVADYAAQDADLAPSLTAGDGGSTGRGEAVRDARQLLDVGP